ncbi:MAG: polyamine aminopropyltransferase [Oscillospiraceae bacterium]|jgi:spermidine synthase|nr:polyamine aminopropyltransferase [Oscillospiraceae bacterium]
MTSTNDLWFSEYHTPDVRFSIKVTEQLYHGKSEFQEIAVFDSAEFGRFLTLDGYMMLTERDEFVYHEMIIHPAFAVNPNIKRVLIIGAGDGGAVRELARYKGVESIDVAEIDGEVITVCKEYLPQTAVGFSDTRVHLHITDGLKYVRKKTDYYDLIIVDSTDPFGAAEGLFTKEFYGNCYTALKSDGILINQNESPFYDNDAKSAKRAKQRISSVFPISAVYSAHITTYPSGLWLFGFASKSFQPLDFDGQLWNALGIKTRYYNTELHKGAFALPTYVRKLFGE